MKRILLLFLALCLCLPLLVSCQNTSGEKDVPSGMLRARSAELDLWIFYPESWSILENAKQLKIASAEQVSLENQLSQEDVTDGKAVLPSNVANVTVFALKEGVEDLEGYAEGDWKAALSASFSFEGSAKEQKLGADDSRIYTYQLLGSEGQVLYRFCQTLILHRETVYAVSFAATPELYEILLDTYRDMASSVTFSEIAAEENTPLTSGADATQSLPREEIVEKEGFAAIGNQGVDFILYCPEDSAFSTVENTGFLGLKTPSGASVSVARGDAYAVQVSSPADYLDEQYYPSFDALYGAHTEVLREEREREDSSLLVVEFTADIGGEGFTFRQALYYRNGYIYTLLYTAKTAEYQEHLGAVEEMIREFTFR